MNKTEDKQWQRHQEWIRVIVNLDDRHDSVTGINGIEVGQLWRNVHTGCVEECLSIHLAGMGAHAGHYESIMLGDKEESFAGMGWSLGSFGPDGHWELVEKVDLGWRMDDDGQFRFVTEDYERVSEQPPWGLSTGEKSVCMSRRWDAPVASEMPEG